MKRNIIQNGFQEKNQLSSLLYLNDYYKCNLIIYNKGLNTYYKTCVKEYDYVICIYENNQWFLDEKQEININEIETYSDIQDLSNVITMDLMTNMIYKLFLVIKFNELFS